MNHFTPEDRVLPSGYTTYALSRIACRGHQFFRFLRRVQDPVWWNRNWWAGKVHEYRRGRDAAASNFVRKFKHNMARDLPSLAPKRTY